MFPASSASSVAVKPPQPVTVQTAQKTTQSAETARTSTGETAASNVKAETTLALKAPEQTAISARLRDQETAERTERVVQVKDAPVGPPPSFEESPLERQARVAFDPPELARDTVREDVLELNADETAFEAETPEVAEAEVPADPPPTKTERAEASFSEARELAEPKEPPAVDVRN